MFIIHKNGNKTSVKPILKSNSTSFMFNNNFCEMNIKKVTFVGGAWGKGLIEGAMQFDAIVLISFWTCNYQYLLGYKVYYLGIQAISTLVYLLLVLDV